VVSKGFSVCLSTVPVSVMFEVVLYASANTTPHRRVLHATTRRDQITTTARALVSGALQRKGSQNRNHPRARSSQQRQQPTTMKTTALLLAAMPVVAHTVSLSESPVVATKPSSSSLRGAASSALPSSSSSSTTLPLPSQEEEDARRSLQLQPDESCYYYGAPGQLTNVTCTPSLLGKCDQLMSSDCATTEQEAIDDATYPCTTFAVWYENSDSCAWAYVCCDNP
jgi:hypothetical protein